MEPLSSVIPLTHAEIIHAIRFEHAKTPTDILARRCRLAMVDLPESKRLLPLVQEELNRFGFPKGSLELEN